MYFFFFSRRLCFVLCPAVACSYAELELCLAASFGLTILPCGTCFETANVPTKDRVSAPLPLLCPARLCSGTARAFRLPCTLFWGRFRRAVPLPARLPPYPPCWMSLHCVVFSSSFIANKSGLCHLFTLILCLYALVCIFN